MNTPDLDAAGQPMGALPVVRHAGLAPSASGDAVLERALAEAIALEARALRVYGVRTTYRIVRHAQSRSETYYRMFEGYPWTSRPEEAGYLATPAIALAHIRALDRHEPPRPGEERTLCVEPIEHVDEVAHTNLRAALRYAKRSRDKYVWQDVASAWRSARNGTLVPCHALKVVRVRWSKQMLGSVSGTHFYPKAPRYMIHLKDDLGFYARTRFPGHDHAVGRLTRDPDEASCFGTREEALKVMATIGDPRLLPTLCVHEVAVERIPHD